MIDLKAIIPLRPSKKMVMSTLIDACSEVNSAISLKIAALARNGRDRELCELKVSPSDYTDAAQFRADYSLVNFLSKWKGLNTGIDTEAVALTAFNEQEKLNSLSNMRIKRNQTSYIQPILHRATYLIGKCIGPFHLGRLEGLEGWGPGGTTDLKRSEAYEDSKLLKLPIPVTRAALPYFRRAIQSDLHWSAALLGTMPCGEFSLMPNCFLLKEDSHIVTVEKNAKTQRTIAIENRGNMFLQKAVGKLFRKCLKRVKVDLDDQTFNQQLARFAYAHGLSTIDLSMASDSLVHELVYALLPIEWAMYLDAIRSKSFTLKGETRMFEKFSSMGNGFTFELESLIFWGLLKASMENEDAISAVYGDDLICPREDAHTLVSTLAYCGFSVNSDKSYIDGSFFESCGHHYFDGKDVTPSYQKNLVDSVDEEVRFVNRIARLVVRFSDNDRAKGPWLVPWLKILRPMILKGYPLYPLGMEGDDGLYVTQSVCDASRIRVSERWRTVRAVAPAIPADDGALVALVLRRTAFQKDPHWFDYIPPDGVVQPTYGLLDSRDVTRRALIWAHRLVAQSDLPWEFYL